MLAAPVKPFESPEPGSESGKLTNRSVIESNAWSPIGLSEYGSCLLARAVNSDGSLHLKIYELIKEGLEHMLLERYCLISLLRQQFVDIPLFSAERGRKVLTSVYPSLSYFVENPTRCSVSWLNAAICNQGFLATAWNNFVLIWIFSEKGVPRVLGAVMPGSLVEDDDSITSAKFSQIESLGPGNETVQIYLEVSRVFACTQTWSLTVNKCSDFSATYIHNAEKVSMREEAETTSLSSKYLNHKSYFSDSVKIGAPGTAVAACSSPNDALDFIVQKTSRSIQILYRVSDQFTCMQAAIEKLIFAAEYRPRTPLMDIAKVISVLYVPRAAPSFSPEKPFNSIIQQFLPGSTLDLPGTLGLRIAFGLCHLLQDASSKKNIILDLLLGREKSRTLACPVCNDPSELANDMKSAVCVKGQQHTSLVCQATMQPVSTDSLLIQCTFCDSIMSLLDHKPVQICKLCRIGITYPL